MGLQADHPALVATGAPFLLGVSYVASLYVWRSKHDRDHPDTIKRRFMSAAFMTLVSPLFVWQCGAANLLDTFSISELLGLRTAGLVQASLLPLLLTMILFLGPTAMLLLDERFRVFCVPMFWKHSLQDWIWWRNHVVAPFSEEFTFRACMVPVLLGYYSHFWAIIISPLFFGVAHFHHMVERIRKGQDVMTSFLVSMFQFAYTTIFGMYSAFLFVKTGHFAAPFIVHAYCNFMGFPDFMEVVNSEPRKRLVLMFLFVMGVVLFYCSYEMLTRPELYSNNVYVGQL